jgi:hypothetical protein
MYHQYGGVRAQLCKLQIDSQPQVIKFTSCLPMSQWFSPGTPASSTTKTDRHDIADILLKVALNTINQIKSTFVSLNNLCPIQMLYS